MSKQHTPGPWHVSNGVQIRSDKHQICKVWMMRNGEGNANARLIAASPDLLDALKAMLEAQHGYEYAGFSEEELASFEKARAAIAKATSSR